MNEKEKFVSRLIKDKELQAKFVLAAQYLIGSGSIIEEIVGPKHIINQYTAILSDIKDIFSNFKANNGIDVEETIKEIYKFYDEEDGKHL